MANSVIFIGWTRASVGREQQAMKLWQDSAEYYEKLKADGKIEDYDLVLLEHHGGDLNGFALLKGDRKKLAEVRREATFMDNAVQAGYCLDGVGIIRGFTGDGLVDVMGRWSKVIGT